MVDRSGGPIEDTLKDGDPVTLEWIEPSKHPNNGGGAFYDHLPGGILSVIGLAGLAGLLIFLIVRKKQRQEEES
jgi:hypothetical protein